MLCQNSLNALLSNWSFILGLFVLIKKASLFSRSKSDLKFFSKILNPFLKNSGLALSIYFYSFSYISPVRKNLLYDNRKLVMNCPLKTDQENVVQKSLSSLVT